MKYNNLGHGHDLKTEQSITVNVPVAITDTRLDLIFPRIRPNNESGQILELLCGP